MTKRRQAHKQPKLPFIGGLMQKLVGDGYLTLIDRAGRTYRFGDERSETKVIARLHDPRLPLRLALSPSPSLTLGEAYMDGRITFESGTLRDFLAIVTSNIAALDGHPLQAIKARFGALARRRRNRKRHARANVAHHYDLSGALYELFLDTDRQYSCAYFARGDERLEAAQAAKRRHLAAKLLLRPGDEILDIGSGWGGLALELAREAEVRVRGITLSSEQLEAARARADGAGFAERVRFDLLDYRDLSGRFDRIVSVGMFEHVGPAHYDDFFMVVAKALKPKGVAVIHSIGRRSPPGGADPWISRYIFPGGYVPALSEVLAAVERSGLWATDIEILRVHYAETLRHWHDRFQRNRHRVRALYDERFCRMWEFYLAMCETMFSQGDLMVFQIQLAHCHEAVPIIRDYITDFDRRGAASGLAADEMRPAKANAPAEREKEAA